MRIPTELISVHGEFELPPGEYKTGKLNRMEEGDVILSIESQMYVYTKVINYKIEYHHDGGDPPLNTETVTESSGKTVKNTFLNDVRLTGDSKKWFKEE